MVSMHSAQDAAPPPADSGTADSSTEATVAPEGGADYSDPNANVTIVAPQLGAASEALAAKWTSDGILSKVQSNSEDDSKDRFDLQNALKLAAPEKTAAMVTMQTQVDKGKEDLIAWTRKVDNVTQLLTADASAGGIQATSRSLMHELPATQKLLSKTMTQQLKNLASDTLMVKTIISDTDKDYQERIQATGDTVKAMFSTQDAAFATMASQQASAMQQSSGDLNRTSSRTVSGIRQDASSTVEAVGTTALKASTGVQTASTALSDSEDVLGEVQSSFKDELGAQTTGLESNLNAMQDSSVDKLGALSDKSLVNVETMAMAAGKDVARTLVQADSSTQRLLNGVMTSVASGTAQLGKAVTASSTSTNRMLDKTSGSIESSLGLVQKEADVSLSDVLQLIMDAKQMLAKQSTTSQSIGGGFSTDIAKLLPLLNGKFNGVTSQAKSVSQDVESGTSSELLHLNDVIAYLVSQSGAQAGELSTRMGSQLSTSQQGQAAALAATQKGINSQSDFLENAMGGVSKSGIKRAGDLTNKANTLSGTLGGSISDLMALISETTGQGANELSQLASGLGSQASDTFSGLVETLKGLNKDGSDSKEDFVTRLLGPAADSAGKSFASMRTFLSNLLGSSEGLSSGQAGAMTHLRAVQAENGKKITNIVQAMKGVDGLNRELGSAVSAQGQSLLASAKTKMTDDLRNSLSALMGQSKDSLATIDNLINGLNGPSSSEAMDAISKSLALSSVNIVSGSRDFGDAEKGQMQALSGLSSMAITLLGQSADQGNADKSQTQASLANARANIVAKFKQVAADSTNTEVGKAMLDLAKAGNDTDIIKYLVSDVSVAMKKIDDDANVARDVNDRKNAQFQSYVDATQAELQKQQAAIVAQLESTIADVQTELQNKTSMINLTQSEMEGTLDEIRQKVVKAQETLGQNLRLYQAKLDEIIGEIRSYMNLSADADDLAIRQDISQQLAKVNATEVAIASANAAVADKLDQQKSAQGSAGASAFAAVNGVIGGAIGVEGGTSNGHLSNDASLIAIAANVDASTQELNGKLSTSAATMQDGITSANTVAGQAVRSSESKSSKSIDQLNQKSSDVAAQSRKSFIRNLEKMGSVDDDTMMVSQQLQTLLSNSDAAINDVSSSVLSHLDLSSKTMASLNSQQARKVASVSDVMGAFTSVVLSFLNETGATMATVMNQLNSVEDGSKLKLEQMDTRSRDELNWVTSNLNATTDSYKLFMDQERTIQSALRQGVLDVENKLALSQAAKSSELDDINESTSELKQSVSKTQAEQLAKVRSWINSRDPVVAKRLLSSPPEASLIQSKVNNSVFRDIRKRIATVKRDMQELTL